MCYLSSDVFIFIMAFNHVLICSLDVYFALPQPLSWIYIFAECLEMFFLSLAALLSKKSRMDT